MATTWRNKKNYPLGTGALNASITDSGLSIVLQSGQGANFPTATFTITIDEEIILIDSRSTDTLTVNASGRGYDSTTASGHDSAASVYQYQIVKDFTDLETAINGIENGTTMQAAVWIQDDADLFFGTDKDIRIRYDEAGDNRLEFHNGTNLLAWITDDGTTGTIGVTTGLIAPQVGPSGDANLLSFAAGVVTVDGSADATRLALANATPSALYDLYINSVDADISHYRARMLHTPTITSTAAHNFTEHLSDSYCSGAFNNTGTMVQFNAYTPGHGTAGQTLTNARAFVGSLNRYPAGTVTNAVAFYVNQGGATGVITNAYAFYADAVTGGSSLNYAIYTNAGLVRFGDNVLIIDNKPLKFGTDSDWQILYDETTDDRLEFTDGTNTFFYMKDNGTTADLGFIDGCNIITGTTTGSIWGTTTSQKQAWWGATPVVQPASANQAVLALDVDVTGGDTVDKAAINVNFTAIQTLVNQLRSDLVTAGLIKGAA